MILDQVFRALGCSWVYPCKQLLLCNLVLLLCVHNLQKVPLLSWSPEIFCAHKNSSGGGICFLRWNHLGRILTPKETRATKKSLTVGQRQKISQKTFVTNRLTDRSTEKWQTVSCPRLKYPIVITTFGSHLSPL